MSAGGAAQSGKADKPAIGGVRRNFAPWKDPSIKPLIRYENVVKRFGDFVAIKPLDLDIYEKEFFSCSGRPAAGRPR